MYFYNQLAHNWFFVYLMAKTTRNLSDYLSKFYIWLLSLKRLNFIFEFP